MTNLKTSPPHPELVVVSGLSGSGKTVALRTLEDLDFYCIDNLPASLLPSLAERLTSARTTHINGATANHSEAATQRIAVGIDARNLAADLRDLPAILEAVQAIGGLHLKVIFLEASDATLIKRFSETRRRHPLTHDGHSLAEAIAIERNMLRDLRDRAVLLMDTTDMNVHQLRREVWTKIGVAGAGSFVLLESFAFKRGVPIDADFVFDVRVLPNPHWQANLREQTGRDPECREWLARQPQVQEMFEDIKRFLERWLPRFDDDQRSYMTVGIGCTGGQHRSVFIAEKLAEHFRKSREQVLLFHRELNDQPRVVSDPPHQDLRPSDAAATSF
jgi:RNase adapter protein RapZ